MKPLFAKGPSRLFRLALVFVLSLVMMVADHRYKHLDGFRASVSTFLSPLLYIANIPAAMGDWFGGSVISRSELSEENSRLRDENLILKAQLQRLISLEAENVILRRMLGSVKKAKGRRVVAEILEVSEDPYRHMVTINKGEMDGVYKGQPVLDGSGIMGQVIEVSQIYSRVLLISDKQHAIPVKINRNGIRAIASGTGVYNRLMLEHVPHTLDIQVGDLVVSSGLGQVFPAGFPVGKVDLVRRDPAEPYSHIELSPAAMLQQSGQVVLVWPPKFQRATAGESEELTDEN